MWTSREVGSGFRGWGLCERMEMLLENNFGRTSGIHQGFNLEMFIVARGSENCRCFLFACRRKTNVYHIFPNSKSPLSQDQTAYFCIFPSGLFHRSAFQPCVFAVFRFRNTRCLTAFSRGSTRCIWLFPVFAIDLQLLCFGKNHLHRTCLLRLSFIFYVIKDPED